MAELRAPTGEQTTVCGQVIVSHVERSSLQVVRREEDICAVCWPWTGFEKVRGQDPASGGTPA